MYPDTNLQSREISFPRDKRWGLALLVMSTLIFFSLTRPDHSSAALPNQVVNASFEYKTGAPVELPANWLPGSFNNECSFDWDSGVAHTGDRSVKSTCPVADGAFWTQSVPVLQNQDYILSGWIKTQDVAHSIDPFDLGAILSVDSGDFNQTAPLWGTNDWTYVSVEFNSGDASMVPISARLGYWYSTTTGTAWFDDIRLELVNDEFVHTAYLPLINRPIESPAYTWKTLVLIYQQTDVTYTWEGQTYHLVTEMDDIDLLRAWKVINEFPKTVSDWSGGYTHITQTLAYPNRPIQTLSDLWGGQGFWVSPSDIQPELNTYAPSGTYDSIIVIWKNDKDGVSVPMAGAWGLALSPSGWSNGAGYSLVNIPQGSSPWFGPYFDEVFVHEWNHQTTGFYGERGYAMPNIDAAGSYGYQSENGSWKTFLSDVMQGKVWDGTTYIGMTTEVWQSATPTQMGLSTFANPIFEPYPILSPEE